MARSRDVRHMQVALVLAQRGLGQVAPNPSVGCVIVRDDRVVGRGWTQPGGRPHAETEALRRAGAQARGATAYVTLEPCAHRGQTGPCWEALVKAGVVRVVGACMDPDPRVNGKGYDLLREAGVEVETGVCEAEALRLNEGFIRRIRDGRPLVMLKLASTADGRTATHTGQSQWITGEAARNRGHLMRAQADAIMVGSTTAIVDDPMLTCRLPGLDLCSPIRIVADGRLRLPLTSALVRHAGDTPLLILTLPGADPDRRAAFKGCGVELLDVPQGADGLMDMAAAFQVLGKRGLTRVLVEGGARIAASLIQAGLVDRIDWFQAPKIIGGDGSPVIAALGIGSLADVQSLEQVSALAVGEDTLCRFIVRR